MLKTIAYKLIKSERFSELVASTIAINILALGSSLYSMHLLNRYVGIGLVPTLITLTVGVLVAILFELALRRLRQKVLSEISTQWDEQASHRLFKAFSASRYDAITSLPLADKREALGAPAVQQQMGSSNNLAAVLDLPFVLLFLLGVSLLYWPLGIVAFLACCAVLWMGVTNERQQRSSSEAHAKANARVQQMNQFLLAAGEVLRTLPVVGSLSRRWSEVQAESLTTRRDSLNVSASQQNTSQSVGQILSVAVYAIGAVAAVKGLITTGALIGASILSARAFAVCSRAAYLADPIVRAMRAEAALKVTEELDREPDEGATPAALMGKLEVVDLTFSYPKQPVPLFERLNVELNSGQVLSIRGPNGSGKSTLIKLMLGVLSPQRGMVRADRIELRQLAASWWRGHIGYAPQETVFFDGTLRENLVLDRNVEDATLLVLMHEMGLDDFLAVDPSGLDRQITSHDTKLAVGVRRRFSLIRAILGNPRVVFLDEPTEGLDQLGQAAVAKLLNRLLQDGVTLVVASNEVFIQRAADWVVDLSKKPTPEVSPREVTLPAAVLASGMASQS